MILDKITLQRSKQRSKGVKKDARRIISMLSIINNFANSSVNTKSLLLYSCMSDMPTLKVKRKV